MPVMLKGQWLGQWVYRAHPDRPVPSEGRPSMSRATNWKGGKKVSVSEAASRAARQVYHTGQGQDEHAAAHSPCHQHHQPLHGLDSAWSWTGNPHRESGTRWRAAADVGQADTLQGGPHTRQKEADGDRLSDS